MMKLISLISIGILWFAASQNFDNYQDSIPESDVTFDMVAIEGGTFVLGSVAQDKKAESDETGSKTIQVESFWMGAKEVTFDEFDIFLNAEKDLDADGNARIDGVMRPSPPYEDPSHNMGGSGYPAVGMTQLGALQYCKWLSDKTGNFYRLPSEAEWEYACKAGTETVYFFGDKPKSMKEYAWHEKNSDRKFHAGGLLKPNPFGLYDMYGNVSEWTLDQYQSDFYASIEGEAINPWCRPTALHPRTVRGGSYRDPVTEMRSSNRIESTLDWKKRDPQIPKSFWWNTDSPFVGFRIIRPYNTPSPEEQAAFWEAVLGG